MKKELIERFKEGKIVINLETQQEWNEFMQWLEDNTEIKWGGGLIYRNHASHQECKIIKYKDLKEKKG